MLREAVYSRFVAEPDIVEQAEEDELDCGGWGHATGKVECEDPVFSDQAAEFQDASAICDSADPSVFDGDCLMNDPRIDWRISDAGGMETDLTYTSKTGEDIIKVTFFKADTEVEQGVCSAACSYLVKERDRVKNLDATKGQALKLVANSIYGGLGFSSYSSYSPICAGSVTAAACSRAALFLMELLVNRLMNATYKIKDSEPYPASRIF